MCVCACMRACVRVCVCVCVVLVMFGLATSGWHISVLLRVPGLTPGVCWHRYEFLSSAGNPGIARGVAVA